MREYKLASGDYRCNVNLKQYESLIMSTIQEIVPDAEVKVEKDRYIILNELTKGEAIKIGRAIARSRLGKYAIQRPVLFVGNDIDEE